MFRKVIKFPIRYHFSTEYDVQYSDINAGNHMAADKILSVTIEAQLRFMRFMNYGYPFAFDETGLITCDSELVYLSESSYGDKLKIDLAVTSFSGKSFDFIYRINNITKNSEVARIKHTMLFYDYKRKQVVIATEQFKKKINDLIF